MGRSMVFRRAIHVPHGWDDGLWLRAVAFWEERGFRFDERHGATQQGRRGSLWGNYTAFDMSKLRATMTIRRIDITNVDFVMEVDTIGQIIAEWNEIHWRMELETLQSWLLEGDKQEARWRAFGKQCRRANWYYIGTFGLFGTRMPED